MTCEKCSEYTDKIIELQDQIIRYQRDRLREMIEAKREPVSEMDAFLGLSRRMTDV